MSVQNVTSRNNLFPHQCVVCDFGTNIKTILELHVLKCHSTRSQLDGAAVKADVARLYDIYDEMVEKILVDKAPMGEKWSECTRMIANAIDISIDVIGRFLLDEEIRLKISEMDKDVEPVLDDDTFVPERKTEEVKEPMRSREYKQIEVEKVTVADMERTIKRLTDKHKKEIKDLERRLIHKHTLYFCEKRKERYAWRLHDKMKEKYEKAKKDLDEVRARFGLENLSLEDRVEEREYYDQIWNEALPSNEDEEMDDDKEKDNDGSFSESFEMCDESPNQSPTGSSDGEEWSQIDNSSQPE